MSAAATPEVSIIVPLGGDPAAAIACLEAIGAQPDDPCFEVVVVPTAPGLEPLLERLDGDVTVVRPVFGATLAAAVRTALPSARAPTVVLIRDAARPGPGWLRTLTQGLVATTPSGLAASGEAVVAARSVGISRSTLDGLALPEVSDELYVAALALAVAEKGLPVRTVEGSRIDPAVSPTAGPRHAPRLPPELTVVIPTLDASSTRVAGCLRALAATTEVPYEVVVLDNGASPQGFADPVNAGLRASRTPYTVVMNDDVLPLPGWWPPLRETLDGGAVVAFPLTVGGAMRMDFPAWCFAFGERARREFSHDEENFFDPALVVWYQDTDLYVRLCAAGVPPALARGSQILHGLSQTVASPDPRLRTWIERQIRADQAAFSAKHPTLNHQLAGAAR